MGHEIVDRVVAVAPGGLRHRVGEIVAIGCMVDLCQHCDQCGKGERRLCREGNASTYGGVDRHTVSQPGAATSSTSLRGRSSCSSRASWSPIDAAADVWRDPALSPRDRSLVTITSLVALHSHNELEGHIKRNLDNRLNRDEIVGAITHVAFTQAGPLR